MNEKLQIDLPIIVEGKYDRLRLLTVCDADIFTTGGFAIFNAKERLALFRRLAERGGILLLTDSDGAGGVIRRYIVSAIPPDRIFHLRIPRIAGKERRKASRSAEGLLGVEGMTPELLRSLLLPFAGGQRPVRAGIGKADLFACGLSGGTDSSSRRDRLAEAFGVPTGMTANALLSALNIITDKETFFRTAETLFAEDSPS